jgi:two-component system chemotaxis response regulator CheB
MENEFYIVGIGASAGGLNALHEFFDNIPKDICAAFIVITHLQRERYSHLASLLSHRTELPVARVDHDLKIRPGNIYVLTENTALTIENGCLKVSERDQLKTNSSINIFFKSLAEEFNERAIGIILSGGGNDGLEGALLLNEMGGNVIVQKLSSAKVEGMPRAIIDHDHPTAVLNPAQLAEEVTRLCKEGTS